MFLYYIYISHYNYLPVFLTVVFSSDIIFSHEITKKQTKVCDKTDRKLRRFNEAKRDELLLRHVQLSCGGGNERLGGNVLGIRPKKQQKLKHIMTTTLIAAHVHHYSA